MQIQHLAYCTFFSVQCYSFQCIMAASRGPITSTVSNALSQAFWPLLI